jgi:hypothetical protein
MEAIIGTGKQLKMAEQPQYLTTPHVIPMNHAAGNMPARPDRPLGHPA